MNIRNNNLPKIVCNNDKEPGYTSRIPKECIAKYPIIWQGIELTY